MGGDVMSRRYVRVARYKHLFVEDTEFCLKCSLRNTDKRIGVGCKVSNDNYVLREKKATNDTLERWDKQWRM